MGLLWFTSQLDVSVKDRQGTGCRRAVAFREGEYLAGPQARKRANWPTMKQILGTKSNTLW
jgi:hypothetical protein